MREKLVYNKTTFTGFVVLARRKKVEKSMQLTA